MKQASLKLNTYIRNASIINGNIERIALNIIFWFFGALAFFYLLFLGNMIKNIIARQSFEANARILSSEVRDLEVIYLSMSNSIDLDLSYSLGFEKTQATFATRKTIGLNFLDSRPVGGAIDEPFDSVKIAQNDL